MHATTMKTKRHYTAPVTQRATVELEGGFCGSVVKENPRTGFVETTSHERNEVSFEDASWNNGEWE